MYPAEGAKPVGHSSSIDRFRTNKTCEAAKPTAGPNDDRIPASRPTSNYSVLSVEQFDGLAISAYHDSEPGNI